MGRSKAEAVESPQGLQYGEMLEAEAETWCIPDAAKRHEKAQRERIRHHKLVKDLLLDKLDTHMMDIAEVGGGPLPVSDLIPFRTRVVYDPCSDEYRRYFPCPDHQTARVEDLGGTPRVDLVIATNSLDHVAEPVRAVDVMADMLFPGGYMAIMCAENNALTNPHPCHEHNLTADKLHQWLDHDYETVWELTFARDGYRYGWVEHQGKRGQPAFALLMRKAVGY